MNLRLVLVVLATPPVLTLIVSALSVVFSPLRRVAKVVRDLQQPPAWICHVVQFRRVRWKAWLWGYLISASLAASWVVAVLTTAACVTIFGGHRFDKTYGTIEGTLESVLGGNGTPQRYCSRCLRWEGKPGRVS